MSSHYATNGGSPSRSNHRREKIVIGRDPVTVTLDSEPAGKPVESAYNGTEYQYFLDDGAAMFYLPPSGRKAILDSGARRGDQLEVSKSRSGEYVVRLLSDAREVTPAPPVPVAAPRPSLAVVPQPAPIELSGDALLARQLAVCICRAIDHIAGIQKYAAAKGYTLQFNEEDIRTLGTTVFIQKCKQEGR